jgi:opacity protein-like surface antigen
MTIRACLAALGLASSAACAAVQAVPQPTPTTEGQITAYLGQRSLDDDDWHPVDDQLTVGVEYAQERMSNPIGWEVGLMASKDEGHVAGSDVEGHTAEVYGGIHKTFGSDTLRPYVGAGLAVIRASVEGPGPDDDDASAAAYAHGGISFALSDEMRLGLDLRFLLGSDIELNGFDTDADYVQLAVGLAFGF